MSKKNGLDNVQIAAPCSANWNDMQGDERTRMSSQCSKNVHNIADMTRKEAEDLLSEQGVSVCMRIFRRGDNTIITDDCPVGLRKLRQGVESLTRAVATILGFVLSASLSAFAAVEEHQVNSKPESMPSGVGGGIGAAVGDSQAENAAQEIDHAPVYIRVVPKDTKLPIMLDTVVDSDTAKDGDEFSATSLQDLTIDGATVVPKGSAIKGRIYCHKCSTRLTALELKFESLTSPGNLPIPLIAHLVTHGGIVKVHRGLKDLTVEIKMDTGVVSLGVKMGGAPVGLQPANKSSMRRYTEEVRIA
jgi:hypothetical protein